MNEDFRLMVIDHLQRGEELPVEWARELFPPEKREYELVYYGKEREEDILAETMAVPLQRVSTFGKNGNGWHNKLIFGDNLQVLKTLLEKKKAGELCNEDGTPGIRFVYIDPPFATKQEFRGTQDQKAYQDKIVGAGYLEFVRRRLIFIRELLADDGVLFFHIDWKKGHYLRALIDEVFGESRFRNEIVWWYYNKMQGNVGRFPSNHETIFFYSAGEKYYFKPQYEERAGGTARLLKRVWDSKSGKLINAKDENGNVIYIETDERRVDDVWRLSMLQPADKTENVGYPTQKPETLLAIMIAATTKPGDLVMDCFAGSGTTLAVAEKLGRRWVGIDSGKLAIYTIQKRMLNLRAEIGNDGKPLKAKPFTLYNAGLYDFSTLRQLPWADWRFFALQLFGCKSEPHKIGGLQLDGKLKGASVLVFNFHDRPGQRIDRDTVEQIHAAVGEKVGRKFFIIAPRGAFDFQQDYIDLDGVRYYAMRIPYSIINELHSREFTALEQPKDEKAVNETVDSVGFDFIQPPQVQWSVGINATEGTLLNEAYLKIKSFKSRVRLRNEDVYGDLETLSTMMLDFNFDGEVFDLDAVFYGDGLKKLGWQARFPYEGLGEKIMVVFLDIHGNEAREVIPREAFGQPKPLASSTKKKGAKKNAR
jgi:site-specific DNA-methyltransferase (adenine-specific)/adenine-specific DNA-methyltransferase